jgi:hypothetical protein
MALRSLSSLSLSRSRPQGWPGERLTPRERQRLEERQRQIEREPVFKPTKYIQAEYERQLRSYARRISEIIDTLAPEGELASPALISHITQAIAAYAQASEPWVNETAARMVMQSWRSDWRKWREHTREAEAMSAELRADLARAPMAASCGKPPPHTPR